MEISEVRVKLVTGGDERLRAFCSVTLDGCFVIRDLKVIDGTTGPFVAMPSRKLTDRCPKCGGKNHLRAQFCNDCGTRLRENRALRDAEGRVKLHADVAHPIRPECREQIQEAVVEAYEREVEASMKPGYRPSLDDDDFGTLDFDDAHPGALPVRSSMPTRKRDDGRRESACPSQEDSGIKRDQGKRQAASAPIQSGKALSKTQKMTQGPQLGGHDAFSAGIL